MYEDATRSETMVQVHIGETGPSISTEEVESALKSMKDGKATGIDEIPTECLKALSAESLSILTELCNKIYSSGYIPDDLLHSVFIKLPKKPNALECSEHRTIALMGHVMKLLLKIILERNEEKIEREIGDCQSGFRPKMGTREGIFNIRTVIERYLEKQRIVYICFIDYEKAFDRVFHERIMDCLGRIDISANDKRLIQNLYWLQHASVRLDQGLSERFPIQRGVRQGCVLSPKLFNLYTEYIFREVEDLPGCHVGGRNVNNFRYADDTALIAESEEALQKIVNEVCIKSEENGLRMNVKKTKVMAVSRDATPNVNILVNGIALEQVKSFKYLGQVITDDGRCETEVRARIAIAKQKFIEMKDVLTSRKLSLPLRKRLVQCYVLSTLLYASETWTLSQNLVGKLEALEMWIYRRMFRISYVDHVTNEEVLQRAKAKRSLIDNIKRRKIEYFGHLVRADNIQKELLVGEIEGTRRRGKQRRKWSTDICEWMESSMEECMRHARNRRQWRIRVVHLLPRR